MSRVVLESAAQAHFQIFVDPKLVAGRCVEAASASGMPLKDLDVVLHRNGLMLQSLREGVVTLVPQSAAPQPADTLVKSRAAPVPLSDAPVEVLVHGHSNRPRMMSLAQDGVLSLSHNQPQAWLETVNVVSALSSLPGISAYADMGLGQAATGNPEFVSIRGLDSSYNGYALNGAMAPESDPNSRSFSLKMFPAAGAQDISVLKTPGADVEGDASGGLVRIDTPTAFDFPGNESRVRWQGAASGLAQAAGFDGQSGLIQGEWARRSPNGKAGIYISGYYGVAHSVAESGEVFSWVPTLQSEAGQTDYTKVSSLSATGYRYDLYRNTLTQYGGNASFVYRWSDASLFLKLVAAAYEGVSDDSQFGLRHMLVNTGQNAEGQALDYWGRAVGAGATGDAAYAPQQVSTNPNWAVGGTDYDASGHYNPNGVFSGYYYQLRDQTADLFQVQLGGKRGGETASIAVAATWAYAQQARPDYLEASSYESPLQSGRMSINWLNGYTPAFTFNNATTAAYLLDPSNVRLWKFQGQDVGSNDATATLKIDGAWRTHASSPFQLRAGLVLARSDRQQFDHALFGNQDGNLTLVTADGYATPYWGAVGPTVTDQAGAWLKAGFLGLPAALKAFSRDQYLAYASPYFYQSVYAIDPTTGAATWPNPGAYSANDYYGGSATSTETINAGYVLGDWRLDALSIQAGARYEYTAFTAHYWVPDTDTDGHFATSSGRYGNFLPNLSLIWKADTSLTYRLSIRRSLSRPAMSIVAGPTVVSNGVVTQSNPDLLPATAVSYDASMSYASSGGTQLDLGVFRKTISHFIYTAAVTSTAPAVDYQVSLDNGLTILTPMNGRSAWVQGIEIGLRTRFTALPGLLSGTGLAMNATIQRSEALNGRADHYGRRTWLPRAPQAMGNIDLFWMGGSLRSDVLVHYTGLQLDNLTSDNLDNYLQPITTVDASVQARLKDYKLSVVLRNLTNAPSLWKTLGPSKQYLGTQDGGGNGSYVIYGTSLSVSIERNW